MAVSEEGEAIKFEQFRIQDLSGRDLGHLLAGCLHLTDEENGLMWQKKNLQNWHPVLGVFIWRSKVSSSLRTFAPAVPVAQSILPLFSSRLSSSSPRFGLNSNFSGKISFTTKLTITNSYSLMNFPAFSP